MTAKLIIDTDPGIDDAMAIQFALQSGEFEIIGFTTVFGNIDVDTATVNTLRLLYLANTPAIPVAKGASKPLNGEFKGGVPFIHGADGQGNTWQPAGPLRPIDIMADEFLINNILKFPGEVTIAAIGPLTNLAAVLKKNPGIQSLVKEIVIMGGNAFCPGNATPAAEANILSDPEAADIVLGAAWPVTMVGLDVTHKIILENNILHEISLHDSAINKQVTAAYLFYLDFFFKTHKMESSYVHDPSVFAYLVNRKLFKTVQYPIRVETTECLGKGKTWPSVHEYDKDKALSLIPWQDRPKINICVDVNSDEVIRLLKGRLVSK